MTVNFGRMCRLCMKQTEKLLPLFCQDNSLTERVMCLSPSLKVSGVAFWTRPKHVFHTFLVLGRDKCKFNKSLHCTSCIWFLLGDGPKVVGTFRRHRSKHFIYASASELLLFYLTKYVKLLKCRMLMDSFNRNEPQTWTAG